MSQKVLRATKSRMAVGKGAEWGECHWRYGAQGNERPGLSWSRFLTLPLPVRKPGQQGRERDRVMAEKLEYIWESIIQVFLSPSGVWLFIAIQIPMWSLIMTSLALWRSGLSAFAPASWVLKFHHWPGWWVHQVLQRGRRGAQIFCCKSMFPLSFTRFCLWPHSIPCPHPPTQNRVPREDQAYWLQEVATLEG